MTDRTLREPTDLDRLSFTAGLVPVVAQDAATGEVRMVAWANREALERTLATGQLHFWSRSREELWRKGETSGNTLELVSLHSDCDDDTVLARVTSTGPTCHTGDRSCFGATPDGSDSDLTGPEPPATDALTSLDRLLEARAEERPAGSYTTRLLEDENLRLKKLGEECAELVVALARSEREEVVGESADLLYHLLVALRAESVGLADVLRELEARRS